MKFYFFAVILIINSCAYSPKMCNCLLEEAKLKTYEIVVIPGVPFENGQWSEMMKARIMWSKYLYDRKITDNVIYSGSAVYSPYYESKIMAMYAEKIGIPARHIFIDTLAEHSTENIYYSYKKARKLGFTKIALASDAFQTKMLQRFTQNRISKDVGFIPIVPDTLHRFETGLNIPVIDPERAFVPQFKSLPSRENFFERLKGTWGLDIDSSAYQ